MVHTQGSDYVLSPCSSGRGSFAADFYHILRNCSENRQGNKNAKKRLKKIKESFFGLRNAKFIAIYGAATKKNAHLLERGLPSNQGDFTAISDIAHLNANCNWGMLNS